jgi:3-hydroxyisobutyrate dehydrogenase
VADVALLGTGRMGAAMASRLVTAGHQLRLWNRTQTKAEGIARSLGGGVVVASQPADAVAESDFVLSVLADGATTCAVLLDSAAIRSMRKGVVVCDLATSGVAAARALAAGLAAEGRAFVDAPVSGSVPTVLAGELLVMASGGLADVDKLRAVLAAFARTVLYVGPAGSGQAMKLSVNLVVHALNAAVSEALQLAEMAGITRKEAFDVLEQSVVAAPFVKYKRAAFLDPEQPVAMSLDLVRKDLALIIALAEQVGSPAQVTDGVARVVRAACDAGMGPQDMAALSRTPHAATD